VLACLPSLILTASFVGSRAGSKIVMLSMWVKLRQLAGLYSLVSLSVWTIPLATALAVLFYVVAALCLRARRERPWQPADGLLLAVAVLTLAFFAAPNQLSGGGFVNHRLLLFPFLTLILWFGTFEHPVRRRLGIQMAAAGISLAFLGLFAWKYAQIDRALAEIVAAGDSIEPDHTVLFLSYAHQGEDGKGGKLAFRTWPFVHAGGYIAARKRLVDLSLYEANEDYFPFYFHPALNPFLHLAAHPLGIESHPPEVDLLGYPRRTGGSVDYVLLWGLRDELRGDPKVRVVEAQLAAAYDLIHRTRDGRVLLYKRRPPI
jgi:hypothetical protein